MKKKQKRSLLTRWFNKSKSQTTHQLQMLSSSNFSISHFNGEIYNTPIVKSCVDSIAKNFAKMKVEHRLKGKVVNDNLTKLLTLRPNPDMNSFEFLYKVASSYYIDNNAYIYIKRDNIGDVIGLYPIPYNRASFKENNSGNLFLEFSFFNGRKIIESVNDIIILRRNYFQNDLYGSDNNALYQLVDMLYQLNQSTQAGIQNSANIRGVVKMEQQLQDEDVAKKKELFNNEFLNTNNNGGVAVVDGNSDYVPINYTFNPISASNIKLLEDKIYDYFGISREIVNGTFNDTQWNAFFASTLQPMIIQFEQEFTAKIFSKNQINFGNEITFSCDMLSYLSPSQKEKAFVSIKEMGVVSKNTICDIFNLPPVDDGTGNEYLTSLNFVNSKIADEYQLQSLNKSKTDSSSEGGE